VALGVSKDKLASHEKFQTKYGLNFPLLADPEGTLITAYGAWKSGKEGQSLERCTFLVDGAGILRQVWRNVKVDGHAEAVLAAIRALPR
jgi:peroxiredoxin Q/BCP